MNTRILSLLALVVLVAGTNSAFSSENNLEPIKAQITKRHDEAVKRLQDWIAQVSIAAEDRGYPEGAEYMAKLARDAGFQQATVINTDGKPGVFATLDAGAPNPARRAKAARPWQTLSHIRGPARGSYDLAQSHPAGLGRGLKLLLLDANVLLALVWPNHPFHHRAVVRLARRE